MMLQNVVAPALDIMKEEAESSGLLIAAPRSLP